MLKVSLWLQIFQRFVLFCFVPELKKMHFFAVVFSKKKFLYFINHYLLGEFQRWRSLVGCRLWGLTELDMTEAT